MNPVKCVPFLVESKQLWGAGVTIVKAKTAPTCCLSGVGGVEVRGWSSSRAVKLCDFCLQVCEMAADISESSGVDCKGDTRNSAKLDSDYPLRVLYCGVL